MAKALSLSSNVILVASTNASEIMNWVETNQQANTKL
jgi:hypothetical protein